MKRNSCIPCYCQKWIIIIVIKYHLYPTLSNRPEKNMHAAEFKTLREAVGLSISTLVKVIDVDERSIRKWESGKKKVPQDVVERLVEIDALISDTAKNEFSNIQKSSQESVVLHRFIEEDDFHNAHPEFEDLPLTTYGVMLFRLRQKFIDLGVPVSIEYKK